MKKLFMFKLLNNVVWMYTKVGKFIDSWKKTIFPFYLDDHSDGAVV